MPEALTKVKTCLERGGAQTFHAGRRAGRWLRAAVLALCGMVSAPLWAANVISIENAKRSDVTADWWIPDARYASKREIEGYASATSVNRGGAINLYVQATNADPFYSITVYRVGWYGGAGRAADGRPDLALP